MPLEGYETPPRDPFKPYDIGGAEAAWRYEDLTADERAVADQGLDEDQSKVQDAYAGAAKAMAARAKADSAAIQLGADPNLDQLGVVP